MVTLSLAQTDFLKTDGMNIRNNMGKGDTVRLYGVNFGGWEIIETWMAPMNGAHNEWDARNLLASRFGWDSAVALKKIYLNSSFQSDDFPRIAAEHLNCVRLPMLWCDYMDTNGNWLKKPDGDTILPCSIPLLSMRVKTAFTLFSTCTARPVRRTARTIRAGKTGSSCTRSRSIRRS